MLTLERVTKRFGGLTAVREVSLEVRAGDLLGIRAIDENTEGLDRPIACAA